MGILTTTAKQGRGELNPDSLTSESEFLLITSHRPLYQPPQDQIHPPLSSREKQWLAKAFQERLKIKTQWIVGSKEEKRVLETSSPYSINLLFHVLHSKCSYMVTKQRWLLFPDCHIQCSSHFAFRLHKGKVCVCLVESFVPSATGELGGESRCSMHVCWVMSEGRARVYTHVSFSQNLSHIG